MTRLFLFLVTLASVYSAAAQSGWQLLPGKTPTHVVSHRYEDVYFTDSVTGFAVALSGNIWKTKDAGRSWSAKFGKPFSLRSIEFLDDRQTGIAGSVDTSGNIYRTSDGGETWTNIANSVPDSVAYNRRRICGIAHWNNTFYAVGAWFSRRAKLYKSIDKGITWKCYYPDSSLISCAVDVCFISQDTGFITGGHWARQFARSVVIKTTDGGVSWTRVFSESGIGGRIWKIQAITPQILVGSIEPYYSDTVAMIKSTDGGNNWTVIGTGYKSVYNPWFLWQTQGIGFINPKHGWLGGYYFGIFETLDGGQNWNYLEFGSNLNRFFVLDSSRVFAGGDDMYFYGGQLPWPAVTAVHQPSSPPHNLYPVTPNPANGTVKIEFDLLNGTDVVLQIVSIDAKRSWELKSGSLAAGHYTCYWDGNEAPAGNYIIWLGTNEIPIVQKFTLQH